jgi:hypothetical protein
VEVDCRSLKLLATFNQVEEASKEESPRPKLERKEEVLLAPVRVRNEIEALFRVVWPETLRVVKVAEVPEAVLKVKLPEEVALVNVILVAEAVPKIPVPET